MTTTLSIKWSCENNAAYDLLDRTYEHLDKRKKAYRDVEQTKRVLSSLLAQRRGPFVVSYAGIPKKDKETLREALECLSGPVLTREGRAVVNTASETSTETLRPRSVRQTQRSPKVALSQPYLRIMGRSTGTEARVKYPSKRLPCLVTQSPP